DYLKKSTVGTGAATKERDVGLGDLIAKTGLATTVVEVFDLSNISDWSMRQLIDAEPEVILVDLGESTAAVPIVQAIHTGLPDARLLVTSSITDPGLIIALLIVGVRCVLPRPLTHTASREAFNRHASATTRAITTTIPR